MVDPDVATLMYRPGQVRMGSRWNRYGSASGELGEDWPRALAHELGHYLFFLHDNYLGIRDQQLVTLDSCPGVMTTPYFDLTSEFHPYQDWDMECRDTLSAHEVGRADWETITTMYEMLSQPAEAIPLAMVNPGPTTLPLAVTQIEEFPQGQGNTIVDPRFFLSTPQWGTCAARL